MSVTRYPTNWRVREDLSRSITPKVFVQDNIVSPAGEWVPAPWLPIAFSKHDAARGYSHFVISSGKVVALQRSPYGTGRRPLIVPAGLRLKLGGTGTTAIFTSTVLVYTSTDADQKVQDLVTGEPVAAAVSYTAQQVANALIERGLVSRRAAVTAGGAVPATTIAHVSKIVDLFISEPVGVVPYDIYSYAGFAEEGDQRFTNWREQAAIAYWTQGQLRLPWRSTAQVTDDDFDVSLLNTTATTYAAGKSVTAGELWKIANLRQITKYEHLAADAEVVALGLDKGQIATVTDRTPITCATAGVLLSQKADPADITSAGDWAVDTDLGILFLSEVTWAALVTANTDPTIKYYYYGTGGTGASAHRYALFEGDAVAGGYVSYDVQSNFFMVADASVAADTRKVLGRLVDFEVWPKQLSQYVKTAWGNVSNMTAVSRMPGTGTKGFPDAFTLPSIDSNLVADRFAIITLNVR